MMKSKNQRSKRRSDSGSKHFRKDRRRKFSGRRSRSRRQQEGIPIHQLINKVKHVDVKPYESDTTFEKMGFHKAILKNLDTLGFVSPTEIQEKSCSTVYEKKDMIGVAKTGTGKTAAFLMPLVNRILKQKSQFQTLVIVPTRELALQVELEFRDISKGMNLYSTSVIGGQSIRNDIRRLRKRNHFVIGTPGRLKDLARRGVLKLNSFSVLVLDEFDRMLDMGFSADVEDLTSKMSNLEQTLLFSATIDKKQQKQIDKLMEAPVLVKVTDGLTAADNVAQDVVRVSRHDKFDKLLDLLVDPGFDKVLLFAETKRNVSKVAERLKEYGVPVDEIHGDKTQAYRKRALQKFKDSKIRVLVATDVAARGLDISEVSHVINYEVPQTYETYIHRIGRTGRAGKSGMALTFVEE